MNLLPKSLKIIKSTPQLSENKKSFSPDPQKTLGPLLAEEERAGCFTLCSSCHMIVNVLCLFLPMLWVDMWFVIATLPGLEVIKLEFILRLKIKRNDWLLGDVSASIKIKGNDWLIVSASSQSLRYILSLTVLNFYNLKASLAFCLCSRCLFLVMLWLGLWLWYFLVIHARLFFSSCFSE